MCFSVSKKNSLFIIFLGLVFLFTSLFSFNVNAMELEKHHEEPSIVELTQDEINTLLQNYYNENPSLLNESISNDFSENTGNIVPFYLGELQYQFKYTQKSSNNVNCILSFRNTDIGNFTNVKGTLLAFRSDGHLLQSVDFNEPVITPSLLNFTEVARMYTLHSGKLPVQFVVTVSFTTPFGQRLSKQFGQIYNG